MDYLLDTTEIIEHLRGDKAINELLEILVQEGSSIGCCCINIAEVYAGVREHEKLLTEKFLNSLKYFDITFDIGKLAGEIKKMQQENGKVMTIADSFISAVAIKNNLTLITKNTKHFSIEGLKILKGDKIGSYLV